MYLMGTWWVECRGDQKTVTIARKRQTGSMTELSGPVAHIHRQTAGLDRDRRTSY